jgi:radical SAM protein with 4Fe4S-binding SPASM domain
MIDHISIENTTLCGANCIVCPRDNVDYKYDTMSFDLFKKSFDEVSELGVKQIAACGFGDPLLDNELGKKLCYAKGKCPDIRLVTTTTGHLLNGKMSDLVCKYFDLVKISIYGITKMIYEKVHRGSLKFEEIKENIDVFLTRSDRPVVVLTFLILPENEMEWKQWKEYYEPLADRIDIWKPRAWPNATRETSWSTNNSDISPEDIRTCGRIQKTNDLLIHTDGSVSLCGIDFNRRLIVGNIYNEKLSDIIKGEEIKRIQKIHSDGRSILRSNLICKNCDLIRDRSNALIYTNGDMQVGKKSLFLDLKM